MTFAVVGFIATTVTTVAAIGGAAFIEPSFLIVPAGFLGTTVLYGMSAGYGFAAQEECLHL